MVLCSGALCSNKACRPCRLVVQFGALLQSRPEMVQARHCLRFASSRDLDDLTSRYWQSCERLPGIRVLRVLCVGDSAATALPVIQSMASTTSPAVVLVLTLRGSAESAVADSRGWTSRGWTFQAFER